MKGILGKGSEKQQAENEQKSGKLYEEIGRLKVEMNWLKKRPDIWAYPSGEAPDV